MPQRFLKPGITNSERWNGVSFAAQSLFVRLLTVVDDYGRCDGRASVILGNCFSVWNAKSPKEAVSLPQTEELLQELADKRIILIYETENQPGGQTKRVLQILQWRERLRLGVKEKWPAFDKTARVVVGLTELPAKNAPEEGKPQQVAATLQEGSLNMQASAPTCEQLSVKGTEGASQEPLEALKAPQQDLGALGEVAGSCSKKLQKTASLVQSSNRPIVQSLLVPRPVVQSTSDQTILDQTIPSPIPSGDFLALRARVGGWLRRRHSTQWTKAETKALRAVAALKTSPEEVDLLERYYAADLPSKSDFRRLDIVTLLNNWNGEIDRARRWAAKPHSTQQIDHSAGF